VIVFDLIWDILNLMSHEPNNFIACLSNKLFIYLRLYYRVTNENL